MRTKDNTVECVIHHTLTSFLFGIDLLYREWESELIITSGSEPYARHSRTSLHYALPARAVDIRIWEVAQVPSPEIQAQAICNARDIFCEECGMPNDWIDIILESDHIHIEFQPKRQEHYFQEGS